MNIADIYAMLHIDDSRVEPQVVASAQRAGDKAGQSLGQRVSAGLSSPQMRRNLTAFGAAAGASLGAASEAAIVLEDQLRTIQTVSPDLNLDQAREDIQALSRETGKTTDDLAAGFYDLVSAGVPASEAISVLRESAKFATGALGTTAESVDLVTSVMNAYGLKAEDAARITDVFAKAVADGKVTASELGASMAQIAPIAASAGVSMEEVSAGFAQLTARGVPATQAATQMRASISALLTPNEALNRIQARTGQNFAELAKERGLAVALEELRKATDTTGGAFDAFSEELKATGGDQAAVSEITRKYAAQLGLTEDQARAFEAAVGSQGIGLALSDLQKKLGAGEAGFAGALGSVEAYNFALLSTGENAGAFAEQIVESTNATGLATDQYNIKSQSMAEQAKRTAAAVVTLAQDVGTTVAPFGQLLFTANAMAPALGGIISPAKALGGVLGGLAARSVPRLAEGFADAAPRIADGLSKGLSRAANSRAVQAAASAAGAVSGRLYGLAVAVGDKISTLLATMWSKVPGNSRIGRAATAAGAAAGTVYGTATGVSAKVAEALTTLWNKIPGNTRITAAVDKAGKFFGTRLGAAVGIGLTIGIGGAIASFAKENIQPHLEPARIQLEEWINSIPWPIGRKDMPDWARMGRETSEGAGKIAQGARESLGPAEGRAIGGSWGDEVVAGAEGALSGGSGRISSASETAASGIDGPFTSNAYDAERAVGSTIDKMVDYIRGAKERFSSAAQAASDAYWEPIELRAEIALVNQQLTDAEFLKQLKSKNADEKASAIAHQNELLRRREELQADLAVAEGAGADERLKILRDSIRLYSERIKTATPEQKLLYQRMIDAAEAEVARIETSVPASAEEAMADYELNIKRRQGPIRTATERTLAPVVDEARQVSEQTYRYGSLAMSNLINGIRSRYATLKATVSDIGVTIGGYLRLASPAKEGELSKGGGPEGWGARFTDLLALGLARRRQRVAEAIRSLAETMAQLPTAPPALPRLPALDRSGVPQVHLPTPRPAMGYSPAYAGAVGGSGGNVFNFPVTVQGLLRARDPRELSNQMRRLAELGVLTPRGLEPTGG